MVDARGRLLIADTDNQRIRRVADLRPDLGKVARAFVSARPGGPAKTRLTTEARQMCVTFVFGEQPAAGLPITVTFTGPRTRVGRVGRESNKRVVSCLKLASNARFRPGPVEDHARGRPPHAEDGRRCGSTCSRSTRAA